MSQGSGLKAWVKIWAWAYSGLTFKAYDNLGWLSLE